MPKKILILIFVLFLLFLFQQETIAATLDYQAQRVEQSHPEIINLQASKAFTFWVNFKNTGRKIWLGTGDKTVTLRTASGQDSVIAHSSWLSKKIAYKVKWSVPVGTVGTFKFAFQAPETNGMYWEKLQLFAGDDLIPGGSIEIPVKVYGGKEPPPPVSPAPAVQPPVETPFWQSIPAELNISTDLKYKQEPEVRVGLFYREVEDKDELPIRIKTLNQAAYEVRGPDDYLFVRATSGDELIIDFDFNINRYLLNDAQGKRLLMTDQILKFISLNPNTIFKIPSWQNGPFWDSPGVIDNEFKGNLEIQYNPTTQRLWAINQLPIETYLKGIKETSDQWPMEFHKAQAIAARTYTIFRLENPKYTATPDEEPIFTLRATQADQVYRGYQSEIRSPNFLQAVQETKGLAAVYQGPVIAAYYFAQTDGRTRSCREAYMCKEQMPYLVSRPDPPGIGKNLRGHGVGMPQYGAKAAAEQGANFSQILKYYYLGIEIKKIYN